MIHECGGGGGGGGGGGYDDDDDDDGDDVRLSHFPSPQRMLCSRVVSFDPNGTRVFNLKI